MNGPQKSEVVFIVAMNPASIGGTRPPAEQVEPRTQAKRNSRDGHTGFTQREDPVLQARTRVRRFAQQNKKERLTSLLHHVNEASLGKAYLGLKRHAAPGEGGLTREDYGKNLKSNLKDLCDRVHKGVYRARPAWRVEIPKEDGSKRLLGVAALEDNILGPYLCLWW